ncbi:unnamed protein product [Caenorhabditis angaria]|uniref:Uncharacterized protein n=1 Tax=Caenorhabditis angaria TaxID=860376 RepID=A0A9P1IT98_9PELO|nr:unnamed protein product [Caenorhabditis angaria]
MSFASFYRKRCAQKFILAYFKHITLRNPNIYHEDFQKIEKGVLTQTYQGAVNSLLSLSSENLEPYYSSLDAMLNYSYLEWEIEFQTIFVRQRENGLLEIRLDHSDSSFFLKSDENVEGGFKIVLIVVF